MIKLNGKFRKFVEKFKKSTGFFLSVLMGGSIFSPAINDFKVNSYEFSVFPQEDFSKNKCKIILTDEIPTGYSQSNKNLAFVNCLTNCNCLATDCNCSGDWYNCQGADCNCFNLISHCDCFHWVPIYVQCQCFSGTSVECNCVTNCQAPQL